MENRRVQRPNFQDLCGLGDVLDRVKVEVLFPLRQPRVAQRVLMQPPAGILVHGPQGCGKTTLVRAMANEARVPIQEIHATEFLIRSPGGPGENMRKIFSEAHMTAPSIIFIDEIDRLVWKKVDVENEMERQRIFAQLKECIDESYSISCRKFKESLDTNCGYVLIIGATNIMWAIDPALRKSGRLEVDIELGYPDEEARFQILEKVTRNLRIDAGIDMRNISRSTSGYVGADWVEIVKQDNVSASEDFMKELHDKMVEVRKVQQPKFEDLCGISDVIDRVKRKVLFPFSHPHMARRLVRKPLAGILLYGPKECGKTTLACSIANEATVPIHEIHAIEFLIQSPGSCQWRRPLRSERFRLK